MDERLILEVLKFPDLYTISSRTYKNLTKKAVIWKQIGINMQMPGSECRKRWKALRDRYLKERKRLMILRSDPAAPERIKEWKLFRTLAFLGPYVKEKGASKTAQPDAGMSQGEDDPLQGAGGDRPFVKTDDDDEDDEADDDDAGRNCGNGDESSNSNSMFTRVFCNTTNGSNPNLPEIGEDHRLEESQQERQLNQQLKAAAAAASKPPNIWSESARSLEIISSSDNVGAPRFQTSQALEQKIMEVFQKEHDDVDLFLMSLAPRIRQLPRRQKNQVMMEFMSVVNKFECPS